MRKQHNNRTEESGKSMHPCNGTNRAGIQKPNPFALELAKSSLPFFGGTSVEPEKKEEEPEATTTTAVTTKTEEVEVPDALAELQKDPAKLAQLLDQVSTLSKKASEADKAAQDAVVKKQADDRAKLDIVQQKDLEIADRDKIIEGMDRVLQNQAIESALNNVKDIKWNSVKQARAELLDAEYEVNIDLEKGEASVTGMETAAKRIASQFPWLVQTATVQQNGGANGSVTGRPRPPSSGAPPANPTTTTDKAKRRAELVSKWPVIAHGRSMAQ